MKDWFKIFALMLLVVFPLALLHEYVGAQGVGSDDFRLSLKQPYNQKALNEYIHSRCRVSALMPQDAKVTVSDLNTHLDIYCWADPDGSGSK